MASTEASMHSAGILYAPYVSLALVLPLESCEFFAVVLTVSTHEVSISNTRERLTEQFSSEASALSCRHPPVPCVSLARISFFNSRQLLASLPSFKPVKCEHLQILERSTDQGDLEASVYSCRYPPCALCTSGSWSFSSSRQLLCLGLITHADGLRFVKHQDAI